MNLQDVFKDLNDKPDYIWERKLDELIAKNHNFYNLNAENKKLVKELIKKHKPMIRKYGGISAYAIRQEEYRLFKEKLKLDLTPEDLKDIKQILEIFKK